MSDNQPGSARSWWLSPAAARFRNPRVVCVTSALDEGALDGSEER